MIPIHELKGILSGIAYNSVLSHNTTFSKSESARRGLAMILGEGRYVKLSDAIP
jgi:hypothetical protein